jgi:hypothetical protein
MCFWKKKKTNEVERETSSETKDSMGVDYLSIVTDQFEPPSTGLRPRPRPRPIWKREVAEDKPNLDEW